MCATKIALTYKVKIVEVAYELEDLSSSLPCKKKFELKCQKSPIRNNVKNFKILFQNNEKKDVCSSSPQLQVPNSSPIHYLLSYINM